MQCNSQYITWQSTALAQQQAWQWSQLDVYIISCSCSLTCHELYHSQQSAAAQAAKEQSPEAAIILSPSLTRLCPGALPERGLCPDVLQVLVL